jgi:hypothetical protein
VKALLLAIAVVLAGCSTVPKERVVYVPKVEYVVRTAPDALKQFPTYPEKIDVTKADQLTLADWIVKNEQYVLALESLLRELIKFYETPVEKAGEKPVPAPAAPASAPKPKDAK